jgi:4-amino-4-deoxy-L-arabinose transferase-like glycosyltransferase
MSAQSEWPKRGLLLLLLFSLFAWFAFLDYRKVVKPDEGRYAELAREMAVSGDWVTPRLNGIKYFEKPPLQYWITAAAYRAFGVHDWTARLWTAVAGFLTLLVTYWAGRELFGQAAGLYAAMILGSGVYFVLMGHLATLDMGLTLFTTLSLVGLCYAQRDSASVRERRFGMLITWAAMALAVLSKGLIGIVLAATTLVLYTLVKRDFALWRRLHMIAGLAVFLALAAPWFVAVSMTNPEFPEFFFIHEHLQRFLTDEARREGPAYYFIPILIVGIMPWLLTMVETLWNAFKKRQVPTRFDAGLLLLIWTLFTLLFFSVSQSKLASYILPIFPSLALLMGKRIAELGTSLLTWHILPVIALSIGAFFFIADSAANNPEIAAQPLFQHYANWLYIATAIVLAGSIYALYQVRRNAKMAAVTALSVAGLLAAQVAGNGYESITPLYSSYWLVEQIRPYLKPAIPFYSVKMYDQTLPFYLRRTVTLVDYWDEFSYGIKQEPQLIIPKMDEFRQRWTRDADALAVMQPELYEELRREGFPMQLLVNDGKRAVVKKSMETK